MPSIGCQVPHMGLLPIFMLQTSMAFQGACLCQGQLMKHGTSHGTEFANEDVATVMDVLQKNGKLALPLDDDNDPT